jgi:hypothetical protein
VSAELELRASAMPEAFLCPGSVRPPELAVTDAGEPARVGSATHEALEQLVEGGEVPWADLPAIATRWAIDVEELRMLCAIAQKLWKQVGSRFPNALTEVHLTHEIEPGLVLSGHLDLLATVGRRAEIGDWKTGRKDSNYRHQMMGYGTLALADDRDLDEVRGTVLWIRDQEIEPYTITRADAAAWLTQLRQRVIDWDGTYYPGEHCGFCRRFHECHAANALVRRDTAIILDVDVAGGLANMSAEQIVSLYRKASLVESTADRVRKAIKAHVVANGNVVSPDGVLTLQTEERRKLVPLAAWPVLEANGFGDEDFAACVGLRVSKVEEVVAKRAGRGAGAGAVRALGEELQAADAIAVNEVKKLVVKRSGSL